MYVISHEHRAQIDGAKASFLKNAEKWVMNNLKNEKESLAELRQDVSNGTKEVLDLLKTLDLVDALEKLCVCFEDTTSDLYYKKILELPYYEMENLWEKFLEYDEMKRIRSLFSDQNLNDQFLMEEQGIRCFVSENHFKGNHVYNELYKMLLDFFEYVFPFEKLDIKKRKYNGYVMCRDLGLNICIYCNSNYTYTIERNVKERNKLTVEEDAKNLISRAPLDHYMAKSKFPIFRLTFDNLIPICDVCNSKIKLDKLLIPSKYLHPYQKVHPKLSMSFADAKHIDIMVGDENSPNEKEKIKRTMEFFETEEVYKTYVSQIKNIWEKGEIYTPDYLEEVGKIIFGDTDGTSNNFYDDILKKYKEYFYSEDFLRDLFGDVKQCDVDNISLGEMRSQLVSQLIDNFMKMKK